MVNGTVEVLFAGQPCLTIQESGCQFMTAEESPFRWRINPVFAKLVYGARIFEDIPYCIDSYESTEEAIAAGLVKLDELGAFSKQYDFPEDSYAATMNLVSEEVKQYTLKNANSIVSATRAYDKIMESIANHTFEDKGRSETFANNELAGEKSPIQSPVKPKPMHKLVGASGTTLSSHDTEGDAMRAYKNLANSRGVKIIKESKAGDVDITPVVEKVSIFSKWKKAGKADE